MSEPLVIGMAAARLVDELTRCALGRHAIAVIGDEPRVAYNRVLLSSVLTGETTPEDIELKPMSRWRDRGVTLKVDLCLPQIKPEHIGDAVHPGSGGTECIPLLRRHVISARPCQR